LLRKNFFSAAQLAAIINDFHNAGLHPQEVAMMSFAQKVITHAHQVSEHDIDQLHAVGMSDEEILDIVLTCAARSFIGITLDALGAEPDIAEMDLEPELLQLLSVGRKVLTRDQTEQS
jgi:alkylhydroperoxidase family enzyme